MTRRRPVRKRHVLLALRDYRRAIHEAVAAYARQAGWELEFTGGALRRGWTGDGVIADLFTAEELAVLGDARRTCIVVRNQVTGPRIRQVHGDAEAIARMAFAHFRERGYRHFATADAQGWYEDPSACFDRVVREAGFPVAYLRWREQVPDDDFARVVEVLGRFLAEQPKPCAVLVSGLWGLGFFYRACERRRLRIPEELAILVNNDDPAICEAFTPTVSSIDGQLSRFGWAMAERLDRLMAGRDRDPAPLLIGPDRIIVRQSTDMIAVPHAPTARAVQHLRTHFREPLSVADLAQVAGVSVMTLEQRFRRHFGRLPRVLLCERRMERAQELLAATDLPLQAIAAETGYGSAMALHTAFTRHVGETPGAWRERERARRAADR